MQEYTRGVCRVFARVIVAFCIAGLLTLLCLPSLASAEPDGGAGVTVEQAANRLVELNTQLEMASEDLAQIEHDIDVTKQQIDELEQDRAKTEEQLAAARKTLSLTVEEMYENGNVSYIEVLLGAVSFDDFVSKLDLLERVSSSRSSAIQKVDELQKQLDDQQASLESQLAEQESLKSQAESKMTTIQTSINASENVYESIPSSMRDEVSERTDTVAAAQGHAGSSSGQQGSQSDGASHAGKPGKDDESSQQTDTAKPSKPDNSSKPSGSSSGSSGGSTSSAGAHPEVVSIAKKYLGVKYVWGGASPSAGFDCSGLTMYCYRQIGIDLSHSSRWQYEEGKHIAKSALQPGDLVFFGPSVSGIHHVGIYCGSGKYIHAPQTGDVVKISNLSSRGDYVGACRP